MPGPVISRPRFFCTWSITPLNSTRAGMCCYKEPHKGGKRLTLKKCQNIKGCFIHKHTSYCQKMNFHPEIAHPTRNTEIRWPVLCLSKYSQAETLDHALKQTSFLPRDLPYKCWHDKLLDLSYLWQHVATLRSSFTQSKYDESSAKSIGYASYRFMALL